jgi:hypothetical protein
MGVANVMRKRPHKISDVSLKRFVGENTRYL